MVELTPGVTADARRPRFAMLDGLRFVAAIAVMGFHYVASNDSIWGRSMAEVAPTAFRTARFGYFGVDLFFVISGFVILLSAWGRTPGAFVASRISRLFPAYWVAVLFTGALLLVTAPDDVSVRQILVNLTMAQSAFDVPHVDGVYWTLWVELHFYVLIGVLLLVGITRERILVFAAVWPIAGMLAERSDAHLVATILEPTYAPLFAGGMLIYLLSLDRRSVITWLLLGANVAWSLPTAASDGTDSIGRLTGAAVGQLVAIVVLVLCFAAVAVVTLTPLRRVSWRWLTVAGLLTYPVYLVHEELGWTLISRTHEALGWPMSVALAASVSIALAALINVSVERPSAGRLRHLIERGLESAPTTLSRRSRRSARALDTE